MLLWILEFHRKRVQVFTTYIMSETALRDANTIPESERKDGRFGNGNFVKPHVEHKDENIEERQKTKTASLVVTPIKKDGTQNYGVEMGNSEVEYIGSENLNTVEDLENCLKVGMLSVLDSKDWVSLCEALNDVRRLSIFHKEAIVGVLNDVISFIVKSLKNPRSAVCKTAIMASADIFKACSDNIIVSVDPLLVQLLLKSSQDKSWNLLSRTEILEFGRRLLCVFVEVYYGWELTGLKPFGIDKLIQIGASQLSDRLPESRNAARTLLLELQSVYEKSHV
ncbi:ARM repeat superfamily protein [Abeliophyllum distichum]|uniref:ARM repeat superfamily protein n=1 Tax=Abeliophyllum distichum TaxID=126358 RepID=A0ABD1SH32_9LAMI